MKSTNHPSNNDTNTSTSNRAGQPVPGPSATPKASQWGLKPSLPPGIRTSAREFVNPVDYQHPFDSMARFAELLALRYDANRTRHAYYRHLRLIHQYFKGDPAILTEAQLRDYFLFVKLKKHWKPKTIRQTLAATRMFFVDLLGHTDWTLFSQIRAKDAPRLPRCDAGYSCRWPGCRNGRRRVEPGPALCGPLTVGQREGDDGRRAPDSWWKGGRA